jgi:hypothetical protein
MLEFLHFWVSLVCKRQRLHAIDSASWGVSQVTTACGKLEDSTPGSQTGATSIDPLETWQSLVWWVSRKQVGRDMAHGTDLKIIHG